MMLNLRYIFVLTAFLLATGTTHACRIEKAYSALYQHDYFKAKKYFTKALKYNTSAAAQGLAIIHYRQDNPFHSKDSALTYINLAHEKWYITSQRKKDLYAKYGFTEDSISSMRQQVSDEFFKAARKRNTVEAFSEFIDLHTWSDKRVMAIKVRDSLAFFNAVDKNISGVYLHYLESYPESEYRDLAEENYHTTLYDEVTGNDKLISYIEFVTLYPDSPMKREAERNIFEIITEPNTQGAYDVFITKYPENSFVQQAWREFYQVYLADYSKERINKFLNKYPSSPIAELVGQDLVMADSMFLPYMKDDAYGYMNIAGEVLIDNEFEFTGFFQEGLAIVVKDGKYGFVNRRKEIQIPCQYESVTDFTNGRSIVELEGKYGMIDRNGKYILACNYEDVGMISHDLAYVSDGSKYGYYDNSGKLRIDHIYDDAYDFDGGKAKVEFEGKQGYIDIYGSFVVPPAYEKISPFYDTLYLFEQDGLLGIMNHKCQIFLEPKFAEVGQFSEGLAIAQLADGYEVVYLDTLGEIVIQNGLVAYPNYLLKGEFRNGVAIMMKNGKYGRIDKTGGVVTPPKYDNIGMGTHLFAFEKAAKWGVMNNANAVIISPKYASVQTVNSKFIIAVLEDTAGVLNPEGNIVIPFAFNSIDPLLDGVFMVTDKSGKGVYKGGMKLTETIYGQIGVYDKDYLYLIKDEELSYINHKTGELIRLRQDG